MNVRQMSDMTHTRHAAGDLDWQLAGNCRRLPVAVADAIFWPAARGRGAGVKRTREAKQVCRWCPVREQCLDYADRLDLAEGVYGGLDGAERRARRQEADLWLKKVRES